MKKDILQTSVQNLFVGCCTHGDEQVGKFLWNNYPYETTKYFKYHAVLCNPEATFLNQRFFEQDLNRSFPGKKDGNYEQKRAYEITKQLQNADFILDIHQTTAKNSTCLLLTELSEKNKEYCNYFDIQTVIIERNQDEKFEFSSVAGQAGGICLDAVFPQKSICVEYSHQPTYLEETAQLEKDFTNFIHQKEKFDNKKYYLMCGSVSKSDLQKMAVNTEQFENLKALTENQKKQLNLDATLLNEEIIPFFIGEKAYKDTFCCLAKRVEV